MRAARHLHRDLIASLHALEPRPIVIVMSSEIEYSRVLLKAGADAFVSKGEPDWLLEKLHRYAEQVNMRGGADRNRTDIHLLRQTISSNIQKERKKIMRGRREEDDDDRQLGRPAGAATATRCARRWSPSATISGSRTIRVRKYLRST